MRAYPSFLPRCTGSDYYYLGWLRNLGEPCSCYPDPSSGVPLVYKQIEVSELVQSGSRVTEWNMLAYFRIPKKRVLSKLDIKSTFHQLQCCHPCLKSAPPSLVSSVRQLPIFM